MIDSHCHPQFPQYDNDRAEVIRRTLATDVKMICVGTDLETSKQAVELAQKYDGIWATVGLHPNDTENFQFSRLPARQAIFNFQKLIDEPKVVAIGEVGLDYYRAVNPPEKQKEVFKQFIELAGLKSLPLVIHSRDAHEDLVSILKPHFANRKSPISGVIHSFTGSWSEAQQFIDLGFYIGLNGIITFSEEYGGMVSRIPLENLLIETDAPYLAPVPHRGKRNEPMYIKYVAEKIAEIKKIGVDKIINITTKNCQKLFKLT
jgi:TatD DNase family protein